MCKEYARLLRLTPFLSKLTFLFGKNVFPLFLKGEYYRVVMRLKDMVNNGAFWALNRSMSAWFGPRLIVGTHFAYGR
jgi:hypothetical protein